MDVISEFCSPGGCSNPPGRYDLGLVIDGSGSVGNYGFAQTKMFLLQLIRQFTVGADATHFGVIVYSDSPELINRFSDAMYYFPIQLKLRILGLEFPDGATRTDKALKMAGAKLYAPGEYRDQVPHVLVVITDGNSEEGSEPYKQVLKPLKVSIKQNNKKVLKNGSELIVRILLIFPFVKKKNRHSTKCIVKVTGRNARRNCLGETRKYCKKRYFVCCSKVHSYPERYHALSLSHI